MKSLLGIVKRWLNLSLLDAVRSGVPLPTRWPFALRGIALIGAIAWVMAAALAMGAPLLRSSGDLAVGSNGLVIPTWSAPFVMWVLIVAIAMAGTAIIHLHPVLRIIGWFVVVGALVPFSTNLANQPAVAGALCGGAALALLALIIVRWRRGFHVLEFVIVAVVVTVATMGPMVVAARNPIFGVDSRPMFIEGVLLNFTSYAIPLMLVAGYAMAQVTSRLATDLGPSLKLGQRGLVVVMVVLALVELGVIGWHVVNRDEEWVGQPVIASAMVVALFVCFAAPLWVRARSVGLPPVAELDEGYDRWLYPIALGLIVLNLPVMVASILTGAAGLWLGPEAATPVLRFSTAISLSPTAGIVWRFVLALGLVIAAWLLARRGRMAGPMVACATAAVLATWAIARATGMPVGYWTVEAITLLSVVVGIIAFVVQLVRGKVDRRVLIGMIGLFVIGIIFPFRHILGEPIDQLLGLSGGALVVFGVGWQILTGGGFTREGNRVAPIPSRVLLFVTNILLTTAVVAWVSLTRISNSAIDPAGFADTGDWMFGSSLLMVVVVTLVVQVCTGGSAASVETREDEALEQQVAAQEFEQAMAWDESVFPGQAQHPQLPNDRW